MTEQTNVMLRASSTFAAPSATAIGLLVTALLLLPASFAGQTGTPDATLLRIMKAEDERRWDQDLGVLLSDKDPAVRKRAALAAGRIGNEGAVQMLVPLLEKDPARDVRAMAAFALGEIGSGSAIKALNDQIDIDTPPTIRAQAVEALGKIAALLPKTEEALAKVARDGIMRTLGIEAGRRSMPDLEVIELAITAALRARPEDAGKLIAEFLRYPDTVPAVAANALARLRANDGNVELLKLLSSAKDPVLRANSARVLGATEEKSAFTELNNRARNDPDSRVRVSAIRALIALKDTRALETLIIDQFPGQRKLSDSELLEVATAIGRLAQGTENAQAIEWLKEARKYLPHSAPEVEMALVRVAPSAYIDELGLAWQTRSTAWRRASTLAQALGEIAALPDTAKDKAGLATRAQEILRSMLNHLSSNVKARKPVAVHSQYAIPDVLRAFAAFKPGDLVEVLRKQLLETDVIVRATAAELLGQLPPDPANAAALAVAFEQASRRDKLNDAQLSILEAIGKQKTDSANKVLKSALSSRDQLVRTRAATYLKDNGVGDFSSRLGVVITGKANADYQRPIARIGKQVRARVVTNRGTFTIELLPEDAPLNVDNFIKLARSGYFRGITFHRVVPNFVAQGGDPRGDGSGGPGYSIRCEINEVRYGRGAVGMALSGKDTGGSQWFVTHSPQPHLDGGYTVFGRVVSGMEVVDEIVRGDVIQSVIITETTHRAKN